jgi:hypothetical protein
MGMPVFRSIVLLTSGERPAIVPIRKIAGHFEVSTLNRGFPFWQRWAEPHRSFSFRTLPFVIRPKRSAVERSTLSISHCEIMLAHDFLEESAAACPM